MLIVADIMRRKGLAVVTAQPTLAVDALISLLVDRGIGAAVVSTDGTHVEGIVSERDVVQALAAHGPQILRSPVVDIATRDVAVASPSDSLEEIMGVMTDRRFRHMPVVVDGALQGIVSIGDVVKARVSQLEMEQHALSTYITTGH